MRYIQNIVLIVVLCIAAQAHALLDLELTQGVKAALPVAFVSFSGEADLPSGQQVSNVIQQDLKNSGEFKLISGEALPAMPHSINEIKPIEWRKAGVGAEYIIVGNVKRLSQHQYRVSVSLVNLYLSGGSEQVSQKAVLFSKVFTVNQLQLRHLSHKISDLIYQSLTGVRGIFSTKLAYVVVKHSGTAHHYSLTVSDYDGKRPKVLVSSDEPMMSPAWSPDGTSLAFVSFQKTFPAIYTVNVRTGELNQVTKLEGINGAPAWSSDGSAIAYVSSPTGHAKIYLKELGSGNVTQLTSGYAIDTEPSFSPDGNSLIFTSNRGGSPQIYKCDLKTKSIERLTYEGKYNARASFAPNGKDIVFLHRENHKYYIAVQDLDTDGLQVVTKTGMAESPNFAPNGKMIIYATSLHDKDQLAIVSSDGQGRSTNR